MSKLLILGAGASQGHGIKSRCKPPLVHEFFNNRFVSRLEDAYLPFFKLLKEVIGISKDELKKKNIEELSAEVEPVWGISLYAKDKTTMDSRFGARLDVISPQDLIRSWIVDTIFLSTSWLSKKTCPYHSQLVQSWLDVTDTIITFNYDTIVDASLWETGTWSEDWGYGWRSLAEPYYVDSFVTGEVLPMHTRKYVGDISTPSKELGIKLLKLHGSLNWFTSRYNRQDRFFTPLNNTKKTDKHQESYEESEFYRKKRLAIGHLKDFNRKFGMRHSRRLAPCVAPRLLAASAKEDSVPDLHGFIEGFKAGGSCVDQGILPMLVFPTPNKSLTELSAAEFPIIWKLAVDAIENAKQAVSIGFSFNDVQFNSIIREGTRLRKRPLPITVVEPEEKKFNEIAARLMKARANVKASYFEGTLADFVLKRA